MIDILQESLNSTLVKNIRKDLRHLPEVSQTLADLDIAMGFLTSIGGKPGLSVVGFMEGTLHMDISLCSPQVGVILVNLFSTSATKCSLC